MVARLQLQELVNLFQDAPECCRFVDQEGRKVFLSGGKVIKFGDGVTSGEAEALRFVRRYSEIPVPEVYDTYLIEEGKVNVIVMEAVEGTSLAVLWPNLSREEKGGFALQVRAIIEELRSLTGKSIGTFDCGPAVDSRRLRIQGGPFDTEREFNDWLLLDMIRTAPQVYRSMLENSMRQDHVIVATHGDMSPTNLLCHRGKIVAVLDWEYSGWYPEYWEYIKFFNAIDRRLDWHEFADRMFPREYFQEFFMDSFLGRLVRH